VSPVFADAARQGSALSARLLGWRPDEFWRATPAELAMAFADPANAAASAPPDRETIAKLMERDADG
jgi:uncharacterized phage protein (TIGR02216 family)